MPFVRAAAASIASRVLGRVMLRDLRTTFRRVVWAGPGEIDLPSGPLVLYANHHYVHDTYLLWLIAVRALGRPARVWMEEWNRVPVFSSLGALPFPPDEPGTRMRTIRDTARWLSAARDPVLFLYPEGALGPPDAGLADFRADLPRLAGVFDDRTSWAPAAIHVTWWGEARPTAVVGVGAPHGTPDGFERERVETLLQSLSFVRPADVEGGKSSVVLDGRRGMDERANLRLAAPLFRRLIGRGGDG